VTGNEGEIMLIINTEAINAANAGEDTPEVVEVNGIPAVRIGWHSTDAWRGYYEATPIDGSGWEPVTDGWMTGEWDDAPAEARGSNVEAKLTAMAEDLEREGYDLLAVFMPTSNVFSTAYDAFKRRR
jgi:hypothetical protein